MDPAVGRQEGYVAGGDQADVPQEPGQADIGADGVGDAVVGKEVAHQQQG